MKTVIFTNQFKRDYKKMKKSGKNLNFLQDTINRLSSGEKLPLYYRDYSLAGKWIGCKECHVQGDWLLIYKIIGQEKIYFFRTGSHSELF